MNAAPLARRTAIALMALGGAAAAAMAQTETRSAQLYRCGPEGRELRDSPCPGAGAASAQTLAYDQPSEAQQRESQQRVAREQRLARELAQQRQQSEAQALRQNSGAASIHSRGRPEPAAPAASAPPGSKKPKLHKPKAPKTAKTPKAAKPAASAAG